MTLSFHFPHNEDDQPKLPDLNRSVIHLDSVPAEDTKARRQLLLEALPLAHQGYWHLLGDSTKRELSTLGLVGKVELPPHLITTAAFDRLLHVLERLPKDAAEYAFSVIEQVVARFGSNATATVTIHLMELQGVCRSSSANPKEEFAMGVRKLALALHEDDNLGLKSFDSLLEDALRARVDKTILNKNLMLYLTTKDYYPQKEALQILFEIGRHNSPPFLEGRRFKKQREEVRHRAETIVSRTYKFTHNFGRFLCETKRVSPDQPSLLARFGEENFDEAWRLKALDKNRSPGPGVLLKSPHVESLFFGGRQADGWYKQAYAPYGDALKQFPKASFLVSRAGFFVFNDAPQYSLPVGDLSLGAREPYCAAFMNNHLTGGFELAGMLPVRIVRRHIIRSLEDMRASDDDGGVADVTAPGFNFDSLAREAMCEKLPALRLANISVAFGGAVAAYPAGSQPYYAWEPVWGEGGRLWQDGLGRIHHAWRALEFDAGDETRGKSAITRRRIEALKPLGEGCKVVADAAEGFLNLLDLFMFRYDAWKCGLTPRQGSNALMLSEAFTEHRVRREQGAARDDFSILCLANRYDWSADPVPVLDTHDLSLRLPTGTAVSLSIEPHGRERAEALWERHIVRQFCNFYEGMQQETERTLVFLPRNHVNLQGAEPTR
jgi:hypothetical protein